MSGDMTVQRVVTIMNDVQLPYDIQWQVIDTGLVVYLQVYADVAGERQQGRKWILSTWMTKSEIVTTAFKAVMAFLEHEAREQFKYKGQAILGPHLNVDVLADLLASQAATMYDARAHLETANV